jgi:nicotinamidase-related amidase
MATVRTGNRLVLLVVDVQKGVVSSAHERAKVVRNIGEIVQRARGKSIPIIWIQHSDADLVLRSENWEIVPELWVEEGERRLDKHHNSAFEETELDEALEAEGATGLVLVGASTNWCIRATAYGALDRGYDVTLISDAHTTESIELKEGEIISAKDIIAELNIAMSWLSYPGRKNQAIRTNEFAF